MEQIAIFCDTDDFCKAYEEYCRNKLLMDKEEVIPRTRMSLSEIMTILIMYQLSGYKTFKWYYTKHLMKHQRKDFPDLVSYNRICRDNEICTCSAYIIHYQSTFWQVFRNIFC